MNQFNGRDSRFYLDSANHVYDNTASGLLSEDVQNAIDELAAGIAGAAYTDEAAQDAVARMLTDTDDVDLAYTDNAGADGTVTATLKKQAISARTEVTAASGDMALIGDSSDSDNLKKTLMPYGGTWITTLTGVTNVTSVTDLSYSYSKFFRVGNMVHCSIALTIQPTAIALTKVGVDLPIASDFVSIYDCIGNGNKKSAGNFTGMIVQADTTNNRAEIQFYPNGTSADDYWVEFTYQVK